MKKYGNWTKNNYIRAFLIGLVISSCMIIPFIIKGHGIFTLIDDFNYQQIPFNMMSNSAIKNGDIYWNWYTDLGSNFIGSYSFYTLGSPFFWLSLIFPPSMFPYLIGPLLILKYSVASLTAYMYIQRFVQYKPYALVGAALYAFSGFQVVNLMFNHFHDVTALFPLLLIGLEELVEKKRFILYTLMAALLSTLSFFFFEGQVIFLVIYFCVRFLSYDFKKHIKEVPKCLAGGLLGMAVSGWILVPSILYTLQNPRIGMGFFNGADALVFDKERYLILLKAFLMPAELPQKISAIIPNNFMSCEIYLPLVGAVLLVLFLMENKTGWISRLIKVLLVFMSIPILNSLFSGLNVTPYFRWLYMPILIFSLASAKVLEGKILEKRKAVAAVFGIYILVLGAFAVYLRYWPWGGGQQGCIYDVGIFKKFLCIAAAGIIITFIAVNVYKNRYTAMILISGIAVCSVFLGVLHINRTQEFYIDEKTEKYVENFLSVCEQVDLPDEDDYRINIDNELGENIPEYLSPNMSLILEKPAVETYHSNISASIYKFHESLGISRIGQVATLLPEDKQGIFDFLSVKYTIGKDESNNQIVVRQNENFLPIGLNYEYYITRSEFMKLDEDIRHQILLKAIVLNDEDVQKSEERLKKLPQEELSRLSEADYDNDIMQRRKNTAQNFERYNSGFSADFKATKDTFVYFSVPYDKGWSAAVNETEVEIKEENGFMMIPVNEGENHIEFKYSVPGLKLGVVCTITVAIGIILCTLFRKKYKKRYKL